MQNKPRSSGCTCKVCLFFLACVVVAVAIIAALPGPIDAVVMELHPFTPLQYNDKLKMAVKLFEGELTGPEGFAMDTQGNMYTGVSDGRIVRFNDTHYTTVATMGPPSFDKCGVASYEHICGRPLGLEMDPINDHLLYIAESYHGLYQLNLDTQELKILVNSTSPPPGFPKIKFVNDLVVLKNGSIFFTDTTSKFSRNEVMKELYEGRATGKLLHYNPITGSLELVLKELTFANGLYLSTNEEFLLISETTVCRIIKYHLTGPRAGSTELFLDGLPGVPDNISPSSSGGLWVGFGASRQNGVYDMLSSKPWIRNFIVKLGLEKLVVKWAPKDGMIIEYSETGELLRSLHDQGGHTIYGVSEVLDVGSSLYLGSYDAPYLARLDLELR